MKDWQNYIDIPSQEHFDPVAQLGGFLSEVTVVDDSGLLLNGVDQYITTQPACAAEFLRAVRSGNVNFAQQHRAAKLLLEIHRASHARSSRVHQLAGEVRETLQLLEGNVGDLMLKQGADLTIDRDRLSEYYGFGGHPGANRYVLSVARSAALCAFIRSYCSRAGRSERVSDLCGLWSLSLTNPQDASTAAEYAGRYGSTAQAEITQSHDSASWDIHFHHFLPWQNWYGLDGVAYQAAAAILSEGLQATVSAVGRLSD